MGSVGHGALWDGHTHTGTLHKHSQPDAFNLHTAAAAAALAPSGGSHISRCVLYRGAGSQRAVAAAAVCKNKKKPCFLL